jgi:uncharacterized protein
LSTLKPPSNNLLRILIIAVFAGLFIASIHCRAESDTATVDYLSVEAGVVDSVYEQHKKSESLFADQTTPLAMFCVSMINLYQRGLSAQEGVSTCQFRPSCSHFSATAIKKYGVIEGVLMTGDRLLRCNPWAKNKYPLWKDNYHFEDPLDEHTLCE